MGHLYGIFIKLWWVIAFLLACTFFYEQGLKKWNDSYQQLTEQLMILKHQKEEALLQQKNLELQINSQSDLAWIELTLMKGLGMVPEGQTKVYFFQEVY